MKSTLFSRISSLYQDESLLLNSGLLGSGLWPVDGSLGQFLYWLIRLNGLKRGLEVGSGVGFSTLYLAHAFRENNGGMTTFEYFLPKVNQLEKHLARYFSQEYERYVRIIPSDLRKGVSHLSRKKYDFVFFDQRKGDYLDHLLLLLPKLSKGAFICADNVISHASACVDYLDVVRNDERFSSVLMSQGAGLEVTRYSC